MVPRLSQRTQHPVEAWRPGGSGHRVNSPSLRRPQASLAASGKADTLPPVTIRIVGALLASAVVLSGCTSEEKKPTVLPPAPSTSPSLTAAAPLPLPLPPEADAATGAAASAFAAYYLDVIARALQTADATQLKSLSDAGCQGCQNFIGAVEGAKETGEVARGGDFNVLFAASPPPVDGGVVVNFRYERAAATVIDESGAVTAELPPDPPLDAQMRLLRRSGGWTVLGFRPHRCPHEPALHRDRHLADL